MLNVFTLASGRLFQEEVDQPDALAHVSPVWVDLEAPTPIEKGWILGRFGLTIPDDIVDDDLEESARFYEEDNGELHIRSDFLIDDGETPRNVRVAFILKDVCCSRSMRRICRCSGCCDCAHGASRR